MSDAVAEKDILMLLLLLLLSFGVHSAKYDIVTRCYGGPRLHHTIIIL